MTIKQGASISLIILSSGVSIFFIVGLIIGSFFKKPEITSLKITKPPIQIIYTGNDKIDLNYLLDAVKGIPYEKYIFNEKTSVNVRTENNTKSIIKVDNIAKHLEIPKDSK